MRPLRLGVVSYLNAVPTVHGLGPDPRFVVEPDVPSRVAARLHAGEIDLGLIPSVEYAFGEYAIVPGIAVASRGSRAVGAPCCIAGRSKASAGWPSTLQPDERALCRSCSASGWASIPNTSCGRRT